MSRVTGGADRRRIGGVGAAWVFLAPWAIVYATFFVYPFVYSFVLALMRFNPLDPSAAAFVGLDNVRRLGGDPDFARALRNTLVFVAGTVPVTTVLALGLATLLRRPVPGRDAFKAAMFLPSIISMVVVALGFKLFYAPQGALNAALGLVGIAPHGWLTDPHTALGAIMAMDVWAAVGYYAVIFHAAYAAIPRELYEAAELDGAGAWAQFRHVTLPMMRPVIGFVVVINAIRSFQVFIEVFVMTQGGPLRSTTTLVLYLYETAFRRLDYGYASTVAWVVFGLSAAFSVAAVRHLRPRFASGGAS